jgi:hypothetical protein
MDEQRHPWRDLEGTAWCALRPLTLPVDDPAWEPILGCAVKLPGGFEVDVDGGRLAQALEAIDLDDTTGSDLFVPVTLKDRAWPPVGLLVLASALREQFTKVQPGSGPRATGTPPACQHPSGAAMGIRPCECCWWRWWRLKLGDQHLGGTR